MTDPIRLIASFAGVLVLSGCVAYRAQPLEPDLLWSDLEKIRLDDLIASEADEGEQPTDEEDRLPVFDYADGLSADEAAALATVLNPDLRAFRMQKQVAEGQLVSAGLLPNPDIDTRWLSPTHGGPTNGEINLLFDLTSALLTRKPRIERAEIALNEIDWAIADREWRLANQTRKAFVDILYWEQALELNGQQKRLLDHLVEITLAQRAAGAVTDLDVVLAESEAAENQRRLIRLTGQQQQAIQRLNLLIGLPPGHDTRLDIPDKPLAYDADPQDLQVLAEQLRHRRPDLRQVEQAYLGSEKDLQIAVIEQFPRLSLGPSYERADGENEFGGVLSAEIPLFNRNQGNIAISTAQREQLRRIYVALMHQARGELYDGWRQIDRLDAELSLYFSDVAPRLQKSLDLTEKAFAAGNLDLFPVILLQGRIIDSKRGILDTLRDHQQAKINLMQATGPEIDVNQDTENPDPQLDPVAAPDAEPALKE
jgi:outer membrane protein, heavy metal efflux system